MYRKPLYWLTDYQRKGDLSMDPTLFPELRPGSTGPIVMLAQARLKEMGFNPGPANGIYNTTTQGAVRSFQASRKLTTDSIVDAETWAHLMPACHHLPKVKMGDSGIYTTVAQAMLRNKHVYPGRVNGAYGEQTAAAVQAYQKSRGIEPSGVMDMRTWQELLGAEIIQSCPPPTCPAGSFAYTVKPGDTLVGIANTYGTTVAAILAINPQITNPNLIFPGQVICVPVTPPPPPPPTCPTGSFAYTVMPGDTLFSIAHKYGTTVAAILAINPQITNPNQIFPGQVICVPVTPPPPPPPTCPTGSFAYTVMPGDTLFSIAHKYGTTVAAILAINPQITNPNLIYPSQVICVPVTPPPPPPPTCPTGSFAYTVMPGDTLFSIAHKYGTTVAAILAINPQITNPNLIYPGPGDLRTRYPAASAATDLPYRKLCLHRECRVIPCLALLIKVRHHRGCDPGYQPADYRSQPDLSGPGDLRTRYPAASAATDLPYRKLCLYRNAW
jgi:LysM repeat protein